MKSITPFLWFDDDAVEAAEFYLQVFEDSERVSEIPGPGKQVGVTIRLKGQQLSLFNGGPMFKLNEAFSLFISCEDQAEVDHYWDALVVGGGSPSQCGWLKDRFGVSWQVVPEMLMSVLAGDDPEGRERAMQAMLKMSKLQIDELQAAYDGA